MIAPDLPTQMIYCFQLMDVPIEEALALLDVAIESIEALHGAANVRLDVRYAIDEAARKVVIDAGTEPGRDLARLFTSSLVAEYGDDAVQISRRQRPVEERVIRVAGATTN